MAFRIFLTAALLLAACANGGGTRPDGGAGFDSGPRRDTGSQPADSGPLPDGGMTMVDSGTVTCPAGQHACGAGCVDDLENLPANGCRLGCGEACPTPPDGAAGCDPTGHCTAECTPPFHTEDGACVCAPRSCEDVGAVCGAPDDGCGTALDCGTCPGGGSCMDGMCACAPDDEEVNDARFMAPNIGTLTDAPDSNRVFSMYNIHSMTDEDWFEVSIRDDFDGGNPQITVALRNIPAGDDYDLAAYFICDSGGDSSTCLSGTTDNMIGRGCASATTGNESVAIATECSGFDEHGALFIHITTTTFAASCANYELEVDVR